MYMSCKKHIPNLAEREKNFFSSNTVETPEQIKYYTKLEKFMVLHKLRCITLQATKGIGYKRKRNRDYGNRKHYVSQL